jgi:hypothetical protein
MMAKQAMLVWRMAKEMDEGTFSSANELMERMMRKVGRNFPFDKKIRVLNFLIP